MFPLARSPLLFTLCIADNVCHELLVACGKEDKAMVI